MELLQKWCQLFLFICFELGLGNLISESSTIRGSVIIIRPCLQSQNGANYLFGLSNY